MARKRIPILFIILTLAVACMPVATATPPPTATVVVDDLAPYRAALTSASQNDLARLDRPTRYSLTLTYDPAAPTLTGSQDVQYVNRQSSALEEVYFRLFANYPESGGRITITRLTADGRPATPTYEAQNTALRVPLAQALVPNAAVNLHLDYTIAIPRNSKSHYADFSASDSITTMPTVYPLIPAYDAKGWHLEVPPAFGDPVYADVSLYAVTMTVPTTTTVMASGSTIDTRDNGDGTTTWRMIGAPMRDFDLNVTHRLEKTSVTVGGTTVISWYEPTDAGSGRKALEFAADALRVFQDRFGAYPYRELDVVETPTTAGGIEYPGIVVIGRDLYRNEREREFFEFATAHEVAHQWWYGVIGNDQINYPWVDEALAQYSALIYAEDVRGAAVGQTILKNYFSGLYNRAKSAGRDAAVNLPVSAFDENDYGAIVYGKGPLFYDALRKKMGDAQFFGFLRTYYERYRYKIASSDDIVNTAESVCNCSVRDEFQQWIQSPAPRGTPTR